MKHIVKYIPYLLKVVFPVCLLFLVTTIGTVVPLAQPFINKIIYDGLIPTYDKEMLLSIVISFAAILIIYSITNLLIEIITTHIRGKLISLIRKDVSSEMLTYRYSFFAEMDIGAVVQRIIPEIDTLASTISSLVKAVACMFQLTIVLVISLIFNFVFFLICLSALIIYIVWHNIFKRPIGHYSSKVQKMQGGLYGYFFENLQNIKLIKLFNNYSRSIELLESRLRAIKKYSLTDSFFRSLLSIASKILDVAILVIVVYSVYKISSGEMTIGFYLILSALLTMIITPVNFLIAMGGCLQSGKIAAERMEEILTGEVETSGKHQFTFVQRNIEFRNVEFSYEKSRTILSGISFEIEKGSSVAFVGPSGSGKSTIIQLLIRLINPTNGFIFIDGNPIQSYDLVSLREKIGVLSQDFFLFNDTVRNNIDPKEIHTTSVIEEFIAKADLSDFQKRLNYNVGEGGWNLSGGERQRLSIARLLARTPGVIILDEATSNLDPRTEYIVMSNIQMLKKQNPQLTIIMVTHRTQHLAEMDTVFLVDSGKIVDHGLHSELISRNKQYVNVLSTLNAM